jgi:hypothetical protein
MIQKTLLAKLARPVLAFVVLAQCFGGLLSVARAAGPNLVANPSLEASASGTSPDHWTSGGFGDALTKAQFTYPVAGIDGAAAAKVSIASQPIDGDVKWYFNEVPVDPFAIYTFSDSYNSNVPSSLVAQFHTSSTSTPFVYVQMGNLASSGGAWLNTGPIQVTAPANSIAVTVFHLITGAGQLTVMR